MPPDKAAVTVFQNDHSGLILRNLWQNESWRLTKQRMHANTSALKALTRLFGAKHVGTQRHACHDTFINGALLNEKGNRVLYSNPGTTGQTNPHKRAHRPTEARLPPPWSCFKQALATPGTTGQTNPHKRAHRPTEARLPPVGTPFVTGVATEGATNPHNRANHPTEARLHPLGSFFLRTIREIVRN
jgi:hypothetical protein